VQLMHFSYPMESNVFVIFTFLGRLLPIRRMAFGEPGHESVVGGDWRAVAPLRKAGGNSSRNVLRISAAFGAMVLGLVVVIAVVSKGGETVSAAELEQADAGLIAQEAVTSSKVNPSPGKLSFFMVQFQAPKFSMLPIS
jgi:hypothetical protein